MIISVYNRTLDFCILLGYKLRYGHMMRTVILGMLFIQERSNNVLFGEQWHFKMMPTANFVKIEMRPVIVSTPHNREVQKAPIIQRAALLCIFFSSLREWYNGTFLKYQSSYLYTSERPLVELPNIFILLIVDNTLLV